MSSGVSALPREVLKLQMLLLDAPSIVSNSGYRGMGEVGVSSVGEDSVDTVAQFCRLIVSRPPQNSHCQSSNWTVVSQNQCMSFIARQM